MEQHIKEPTQLKLYFLSDKKDFEAVLKLDFITIEDYTLNAINYCLVFKDNRTGEKFIIASKISPKEVDSKKFVDIFLKYPMYT
jgi:hypothetical protein